MLTNRSAPPVTVTPVLIYPDVRAAVAWLESKVRVPDLDAAFTRARDFGARVLEEPKTHEYGERSCVVEDLGGHRWELTESVRDVEPEEWGGVTVSPW
ncbi:MAG: VOC family protein [Actinomycetota bacterium]|nr:VOC family protein [Actinomycetota bacterium]